MDVCHPLREVVHVCQGEMLIISDNVLPENIVGVHEMKSIKGEKPSTLSAIHIEVIDVIDAPLLIHHTHLLSESLQVGICYCASERSIIVEAYEAFWMDSRSNSGLLYYVNKCT